MPITTLLDPSLLPARTMDQPTFDAAMAYLMTNLPVWGAQVNATEIGMNLLAAGGAYAIPYTYRSNSSNVGASAGGMLAIKSTTIQLDTKSSAGVSVTSVLATFDDSTSSVSGQLRIQKVGDTSKWALYNITTYTLGGTGLYADLGMSFVASSNGAIPFADNDPIMVFYQRSGDKGDTGPAGATLTGVLHVADIRNSGTMGQGAAAGTNTRTLNTVVRNTISGASLASNQVTLPAGTYRVNGSVPAYGVGQHQAYLYNTTTSSNILAGTSEADSGSNSRSELLREIVLAAQSVIEVRHWLGSSSGSLGNPTGSGVGEVYTQVIFEKVA